MKFHRLMRAHVDEFVGASGGIGEHFLQGAEEAAQRDAADGAGARHAPPPTLMNNL